MSKRRPMLRILSALVLLLGGGFLLATGQAPGLAWALIVWGAAAAATSGGRWRADESPTRLPCC